MSSLQPTTETDPVIPNYVAGEWLRPNGVDCLTCVDPATGETLGLVPLSGKSEVSAAVEKAAAAQKVWAETPPQVRVRVLYKFRELLDANRHEIAKIVTQDMGKTVADAAAEVGRAIESVEAAMSAPFMLRGQNLEGIATDVDIEMFRQPLGVVAAITPFNFPAMIPMWFVPFAIACGNSVILKPSEQDPFTSVKYMELFDQIPELPKGVVNLVHGGHDAVNSLLADPGIAAVSFVGSSKTARYITEKATQSGKRVQALGGAKNSMIIMPDADPQVMAAGVIGSAFGAAGQRCMAGSIAILVGDLAEQNRSLQLILDEAASLKVGAGSDPEVFVCPLVTSDARSRVANAITEAENDGIKIALDGRTADVGAGQANLGPTVLDQIPVGHRVLTEELFGPVLSVLRADSLEQAIKLANETPYGNSTILFTQSGSSARTFRRQADSGMLGVNVGVAAPIAWFPFGGWKDSLEGDLHANGEDAFNFYTRKKVVTSRWT